MDFNLQALTIIFRLHDLSQNYILQQKRHRNKFRMSSTYTKGADSNDSVNYFITINGKQVFFSTAKLMSCY